MSDETISGMLSDFCEGERPTPVKDGNPITIWVSSEDHARYKRIQKQSHQKFSKKLRDILKAALIEAERRLSEHHN